MSHAAIIDCPCGCPKTPKLDSPSVISHFLKAPYILSSADMPIPSPKRAQRRSPRTSFAETTTAVIRSQDGCRVQGKVEVISVTGGLLCLSKPLNQGSRVKLMFLTSKGSVLGAAEMLTPISWVQQPFKFVRLHDDDQDRLQAAIQMSLEQNHRDHGQMERYRAW